MFLPETGQRFRAPRLATGVAALGLLGLLASACGGDGDPAGDPATSAPASSPTAGTGDGETPGDAAADGLYFYPPVEGATLTMANSGGGASTTEVTVDRVAAEGGGQTVSATETVAGAGEPVEVERIFRTGADGSLTIDAAAFGASGAGTEVTAVGDDVLIPPISELESGSSSTGETFVELAGAGFSGRMDVSYTVTGDGFTSVTVPFGTVDAYVVQLDLDIESSLAGAVDGASTYWIVPGFGVVRQEVTIAGAALVSELTASSVPLP